MAYVPRRKGDVQGKSCVSIFKLFIVNTLIIFSIIIMEIHYIDHLGVLWPLEAMWHEIINLKDIMVY